MAMTKILAITTHATDDPTRATLAFVLAAGAIETDKEAAIALIADGAFLAKPEIAKNIHGVAAPPLPDLISKIVEAKIPVYI